MEGVPSKVASAAQAQAPPSSLQQGCVPHTHENHHHGHMVHACMHVCICKPLFPSLPYPVATFTSLLQDVRPHLRLYDEAECIAAVQSRLLNASQQVTRGTATVQHFQQRLLDVCYCNTAQKLEQALLPELGLRLYVEAVKDREREALKALLGPVSMSLECYSVSVMGAGTFVRL